MEAFNWFLQGRLAGAGQPGLMGPLEEDLRWLQRLGVVRIVSLRRSSADVYREVRDQAAAFVLGRHPIDDMGAPTPAEALAICSDVLRGIEQIGPTLIHCKAGLGRTGTIAAAIHVSLGCPASEAITKVRSLSTHYIQSQRQVSFLSHYEEHLDQLASTGGLPPNFAHRCEQAGESSRS